MNFGRFKRREFLALVGSAAAAWPLEVAPARADLAAYFSKAEPNYRWQQRAQTKVEGVTIYELHLVSQTWRGMDWEHRLVIYRPHNAKYPHFSMLYNTGGSRSNDIDPMVLRMARETGAVYAILYNIPNQPLFGGKNEDALVVHTWIQFMQTGDESWPLHVPMAKAVLKSMDAIQEFFKRRNLPQIEGFLINGSSKRGWTTWLAAASRDPRIKAIAPMVIDTLNLPAQSEYQMSYYGGGSEQIKEYKNAGMYDALKTPRGKRLIELVDPYSYREIPHAAQAAHPGHQRPLLAAGRPESLLGRTRKPQVGDVRPQQRTQPGRSRAGVEHARRVCPRHRRK